MPVYKRTNDNQGRLVRTGADYYKASGRVKDQLHIVTAAEETSKIINVGFRYTPSANELEVFLNGQLLRVKETISSIVYGDYTETSNLTVTFEDGVIHTGDKLRFRISLTSYDFSDMGNSSRSMVNNIQQLARTMYGREDSSILTGGAIGYGVTEVLAVSYGSELNDTTIQSAITAIGSSNHKLTLSQGTWNIDDDLTIPSNIVLNVPPSALISVASGKTLTINGGFEAGIYEVFDKDASGTISFSDSSIIYSYPEWWGIDGVNDEVQINKALEASRNVILSYKEYIIESSIEIPMHGLAYSTPYQIIGQGATDASSSFGSRLSWYGGNSDIVLSLGTSSIVKNLSIINQNSSTALIGISCDGVSPTIWRMNIILDNIEVKSCAIGYSMIYAGMIHGRRLDADSCGYGFSLGYASNGMQFDNCSANGCAIGVADKVLGESVFGANTLVFNSLDIELNIVVGLELGANSTSIVINGLYAENNTKTARLRGHVTINGGYINEVNDKPFEIGGGEAIKRLEFNNFWVNNAVTQLIEITELTITNFAVRSIKLPVGCQNNICVANSILNEPTLLTFGILDPESYQKVETGWIDVSLGTIYTPLTMLNENWITGGWSNPSYLVAVYMVVSQDITPIAPNFDVVVSIAGGTSLATRSFPSGADVIRGSYLISLVSGAATRWYSYTNSYFTVTNQATSGSVKFVLFFA